MNYITQNQSAASRLQTAKERIRSQKHLFEVYPQVMVWDHS